MDASRGRPVEAPGSRPADPGGGSVCPRRIQRRTATSNTRYFKNVSWGNSA